MHVGYQLEEVGRIAHFAHTVSPKEVAPFLLFMLLLRLRECFCPRTRCFL